MPQRALALTLLLLYALVAAGVNAKLASRTTTTHSKPFYNSHQRVKPTNLTSSYLQQNRNLLRTVEKRMLDMFGMRARPRPKRNVPVSDYMWELYEKQSRLNRRLKNNPTTNTIRCFRGKEKHVDDPHLASFKFNVKSLPKHESVWAAELVLYRRKSTSNRVHRVQVYDVLRSESNDQILRLVDSRSLRGQNKAGRWESFDVLPALQRWRQEPSSNHGLLVQTSGASVNNSTPHHVRLKRETGESRDRWLEYQPLLVTYSRDIRDTSNSLLSRTRRSTRKHRRKGRKDNCRRHALYVDFSDVGWNDWIVAPPGYDAYFCHGDCPFPLTDHLNSTNHAIVQTLVNSVNPAAVPRACCVPTELSPISMLYVDEYDKVVLKNYQDMVVEGCGCR